MFLLTTILFGGYNLKNGSGGLDMALYKSAGELIGNTPLLELCALAKAQGLKCRLLAKMESFNPAGSSKDRVALSMIEDAEKRGLLKDGSVIIEPTSGNTGIGLASVAATRGYRTIIVMPDSMSKERQMLMKAYGAELVLTPGSLGMQGAIDKAEAMAKEIPGSFIPDQFGNPANAEAHRKTTGPEIWADTDGQVDIFVAGVGTGGTITGVGEFLKSKNPNVQVVAVEPADSPLLSGGKAGPHGLQGIGANFVPKVLNTEIYDRIIPVTQEEAFEAARLLGRREGVLVGISSGAALHAAMTLAKENEGKTIVVLLPDTGDRYLSTALFA
jgi:cysteine synthase A